MPRNPQRRRTRALPLALTLLFLGAGLAGCADGGFLGRGSVTINGAGATFAFPIISLYSAKYHEATGQRVNYNSIGSGGGINNHIQKTVHFAASEAPLNAEQASRAPGTLTIPFVIGTVTAAYNVPGVDALRLTGEVLADMYLEKITRWDDPRIQEHNPGIDLPDRRIHIVHRSDGSGTTYVWVDYLSKVSDEWRERVGVGTSVSWPTGVGGNGNEGVAGAILNTPYSIGYIELSYASTLGVTTAAIRNQEGQFVAPSLEAATVAAAGAVEALPPSHESWTRVSFTDAAGDGAYPVASFSYFFIYEDLAELGPHVSKDMAQRIVDWIAWAVTEGQPYNTDVRNAAIPTGVRQLNLEGLGRANWNGEPMELRYHL